MDKKAQLKNLISSYRFNPYRNYKVTAKKNIKNILYEKVFQPDKKNWIIELKNNDGINGLALIKKLPWDSVHFGISMAEIEFIISNGNISLKEEIDIKNFLIKETLNISKKSGIKHIRIKADCADHTTILILQKKGFVLMDTLSTFIFTQRHMVPRLKDLYKIRDSKKEDLTALKKIAKESFKNSRFHRDPQIDNEKADLLYVKWIENAYKKDMADFMLVAEKNNTPLGFFTAQINRELLKATGIKCLGRGLAAVSPKATGAYIGLIKGALLKGMKSMKVDVGEFQTQSYNYPVIKVYQRIGMDLVLSQFIFHKNL